MRSILVSLWVWTAILVLMIAWVPLMAVVRLFDRDPALYRSGYMLRRLGRAITYVNPFWDITVDGDFPEDPRNPYVCVSNHLSQGDPPIVARVPWEMKWVAKIELFRTPITGQLLRLSGDIPVDRHDKDSRAKVLGRARHYLDHRCSVMFFPEGTRSRDGRVHRFADGAFRLAIKAGVPVLPIAIDGTRGALPKHSIWFQPNPETIRVRVLPAVDTSDYEPGDGRDLQREVRRRIIAQVAEWRGVDPESLDALADDLAVAASRRTASDEQNASDDPEAADKDAADEDAADEDTVDEDTASNGSTGTSPRGEASVKPSEASDRAEPAP
jgi:1-acyl-sn-glycerol-3-phosphate acyltransferase